MARGGGAVLSEGGGGREGEVVAGVVEGEGWSEGGGGIGEFGLMFCVWVRRRGDEDSLESEFVVNWELEESVGLMD